MTTFIRAGKSVLLKFGQDIIKGDMAFGVALFHISISVGGCVNIHGL